MANSSLDPQNPKEPYAIVQFDDIDEEGKLCIDLVLKKWFITRGNKNMCKYPPEAQYHLRDQFFEEFRTPEKLWPCVPYTFIVGAENVAQGHRRLQRAHFTKDCQTTDMEGEKSAKAPLLLSKSQISETLHDRLPMRSNSALQRKNTPTGTRSKSESRFNRINVIASDSDSEHEEHRSTYSSHLSPLRKSHNTDKAYQTKQSSSNSKKINASNPRKQLFKSVESKQSEDDSTLNVLTPNKRPTSMSQQLLTLSMKEKSKGGEKVSNDLKNYIEKKIENLRERIGYDLRTKINELKNTIIGANLTSAAGPNLTSTKTRLSVKVPIETLNEFLNYKNVLKNDKDEIEALQMFFRVLINSQTKANSCIATIMVATLHKAVKLEYSGFGRSVAGNSKRNFNTTKTCIIMKEAIMDKLGEGLETANLQSKISKWLSGAKDRQGGRKFR